MNRDNGCLENVGIFIGCLNYLCAIIGIFFLLSEKIISNRLSYYAIILLSVAFVIYSFVRISKYKDIVRETKEKYEYKRKELVKEYEKKHLSLTKEFQEKEKELEKKKSKLNQEKDAVKLIMESSAPFTFSASLCTDFSLIVLDEIENHHRRKIRPAKSAANDMKKFKERCRAAESEYKQMLYKYEYLINTFPELKKYVDDEEALVSLSQYDDLSEFNVEKDNAREYLSTEEWVKLSVDERNQLALDRYKASRQKSNWKIGIEYEMFVEYKLRTTGFYTIPFGSLKGLNDLGRDIIAKKVDENGILKTYIIQCKLRSEKEDKEIHENVVCQIFGSAFEYSLNHRWLFPDSVIPCIVSNVPLSKTASEFAKKLNVIHKLVKKGEYPMIKCNIAKDGEKIYHLPFDQQYHTTIIDKAGEFYAWTVKEATSAGFRRAFRYYGN